MATISILGLYKWNENLFDDMVMPSFEKDGITYTLDRSELVDELLMNLAELECLYADAEVMQEFIRIWSKGRESSWSKMYRVLMEEYDPFINIRRHEHREIIQTPNTISTYEQKVNAWNDIDEPSDKQSSTNRQTGNVKTVEDFTLEGDSAITDAQDVMKKEIEVRSQYNMIDMIVEEFKRQFCLCVY